MVYVPFVMPFFRKKEESKPSGFPSKGEGRFEPYLMKVIVRNSHGKRFGTVIRLNLIDELPKKLEHIGFYKIEETHILDSFETMVYEEQNKLVKEGKEI